MRILFILENYYPNIGGVETLFKALCEALAAAGHSVQVLTHRLHKGLDKYEIINGVEVHRVDVPNRYFFTFLCLRAAFRLAKEADLIHTTSYNAALPAWVVAKFRRKRIVITFHEVWGRLWFRLPFLNVVSRLSFFLFEQMILRLGYDRIIAVSESTRIRLKAAGIRPERIVRIYNGLDYSEFSGMPEMSSEQHTPFTYTYFGRLGISKGLDLLLDAARILHKKDQATHLKLIIPKTPEAFFRRIWKLIIRYELEDYVEILHELSWEALRSELQASDCVVIPSYSEGFCFAAAEAVALSVPVIHSGKGALSEVVSGRFIQMEAFTARGLLTALQDAIEGKWNEKPLRKYELEDTIQSYLELYASYS